MSWIENELTFANSLLFDHSTKCADFIKDIFTELATELRTLDLKVDIKACTEEPVIMPTQAVIQLSRPQARAPRLSPQAQPKRQFSFTPSPTRRSPEHKKMMLNRPVTAPTFNASLRAPLREVSDNTTPRRLKSGNTGSVRGDNSINSHNSSPRRSPLRPSTHQKLHLSSQLSSSQCSPQRSPQRSSQASPQRPQYASKSTVRYPPLDTERLSSKPVSRLLMPTASSLQHASPPKKVQVSTNANADSNTNANANAKVNSSPKKLFPPLPKPSAASSTATLLVNNPVRPIHSKIPVSINSADTTLPSGYSTQTPFRVGLKKPLPSRPITAPSPSQVTLPDISDNDSGASLLRSWAATPEITRQLHTQGLIDPMTVFGAVEPLEIDKVFAKPRVLKGRARTSSAAWEHDGLTIKERSEFARDMGWKEEF